MTSARKRVAILISGRGSNMRKLVEAAHDPAFPAEIVLVVADRSDAQGIAFARGEGLPADIIDFKSSGDRASFEAELEARIADAGAEFVCLAGFMRLLSPPFVERWRDRLLNVHPALLPSFKGLDTHARALQAGVRIHGCTVHFVRADVDSGPIIIQAAVPVRPDDTEESLAARVLSAEHRIYPWALAAVASGRTRVVGNRVLIAGEQPASADLYAIPNL